MNKVVYREKSLVPGCNTLANRRGKMERKQKLVINEVKRQLADYNLQAADIQI